MFFEVFLNVGGFEINFTGNLAVWQYSIIAVRLKGAFRNFKRKARFLHIEPLFIQRLVVKLSLAYCVCNVFDFLINATYASDVIVITSIFLGFNC